MSDGWQLRATLLGLAASLDLAGEIAPFHDIRSLQSGVLCKTSFYDVSCKCQWFLDITLADGSNVRLVRLQRPLTNSLHKYQLSSIVWFWCWDAVR